MDRSGGRGGRRRYRLNACQLLARVRTTGARKKRRCHSRRRTHKSRRRLRWPLRISFARGGPARSDREGRPASAGVVLASRGGLRSQTRIGERASRKAKDHRESQADASGHGLASFCGPAMLACRRGCAQAGMQHRRRSIDRPVALAHAWANDLRGSNVSALSGEHCHG